MPRHPALIPLSHEHHHGLALALRCRKQALGHLKPTGPTGLKQRADELRAFFHATLERHFKAEEEILFPFLRDAAGGLVGDLVEDHARLRALVSRLDDEGALAKILFDAGDLLERHIRREERELFAIFESQADAALTAEVESRLEAFYE